MSPSSLPLSSLVDDDNPGESKTWVRGLGVGVGGVSNPSASFVAAQTITVGHNYSLITGYSHTFIQHLENFVSTFCQI